MKLYTTNAAATGSAPEPAMNASRVDDRGVRRCDHGGWAMQGWQPRLLIRLRHRAHG